ncbi:hypothetical protein Nepgr_024275 [Nepenthes gracilis]|uniref:PPC domain-containing protein n=1 Tax=Nepenthes gracilis TaxID=150966 RepID=A0AAD3T4C3_NEPGR|nr:hypothetical protein Nepgr_024275 [Nepenthes gracilis]
MAMKSGYWDERDSAGDLFHSQTQRFQRPLHPTPQYHHHFHLSTTTSEEADSAAPTTTTAIPPPAKKAKAANEDGATIEVVRRPRGRPPGSKNRPKPSPIITSEPDPVMSPYILEVSGGVDIIDSLKSFTRRRNVGLCVLTASGSVANVSLRQPSTTSPGGTVTFHGCFEILSLSAALIVGGGGFGDGLFTISLAGPSGQIMGGKVVGSLLAAGTVYVIAASFNNPSFHRLPVDNEEVHHSLVGGSVCDGQNIASPGISNGGDGGHPARGGELLGMYRFRLVSDVFGAAAATARPPPPY